MSTNTENKEPQTTQPSYPAIFNRWIAEIGTGHPDALPRRVTKKFHGKEISGWSGKINILDVQGYPDNKRLKYHLIEWQKKPGKAGAIPTTQEIYEMMLKVDETEPEDKNIFCLDRLAKSIARNGVQEDIIVFMDTTGQTVLWDGNRRFFSTYHIMAKEEYESARKEAQWIPCFLIESSGDPVIDSKRKQTILTETNFVEKDSISWPTYIKAEEIWEQFNIRTKMDPTDPVLARKVRGELALEYGLYKKGQPAPREVEKMVRMVDLARDFKDHQVNQRNKDENLVDLAISRDFFWYFDELEFKKEVRDTIRDNAKREEVFDWLWDEKFPSFSAVRRIPEIFNDAVALARMRTGTGPQAFRDANDTIIANDPRLVKDKQAAGPRIRQFKDWLNSFKPADFSQLDGQALRDLKEILVLTTKMLDGLLSDQPAIVTDAKAPEQNTN